MPLLLPFALTFKRITTDGPDAIQAVVAAANGDEFDLALSLEAAPPHRISAIRIVPRGP
jgi:hypothetical protein